jgi:acetylglutamate kinase
MKNEEMARLFSEATPYIQKYHGKTMVIKYGGNAMINETLKDAVMNDLVTLTLLGVRVVLVHGGGPAINEMLKKVGVESRFAGGLRVTDGQGEQRPGGQAPGPRRGPVRHGRPDAALR